MKLVEVGLDSRQFYMTQEFDNLIGWQIDDILTDEIWCSLDWFDVSSTMEFYEAN